MPAEIHATLNLALDIRIPADYITDENQRLRAYRRIANTRDAEERERIGKELEDRYGPVPEAVKNLLEYAALKSLAEKMGVERVERRQGALQIKFHEQTRVDPAKLMNLVRRTRGAQFTPAGVLQVPLDGASSPAAVLSFVSQRLDELKA